MDALLSDLLLFALYTLSLVGVLLFRKYQQNELNVEEKLKGPHYWGVYENNKRVESPTPREESEIAP